MADTFGKLKSALNRGVTTISVKSSSALEKSKIRTHIDSLNNEIQKLYLEVGQTAYTKWLEHDADCAKLEQLFLEIQAKQKNIEELEAELNSIDERDNQILGTQAEKVVEAAVVCPNCGARYAEVVKFCRNCGAKLQD